MKKNKLFLKLMGGVGNQMFQYAAVYQVAKNKGFEIIVDKSSFYTWAWLRKGVYQLGYIVEGIVEKRNPIYFKLLYMRKPIPTLYKFIRAVMNKIKNITKNIYYEKKEFSYDSGIENIKNGMEVLGYFQSYKYFDEYSDDIKKIFGNITMSSGANKYLNNIHKSTCSISIHYRNYHDPLNGNKEVADILGQISIEYYKKALEIIHEKYPDADIYIFSNTIDTAKDLFKNYENTFFVSYDINEEYHADDMVLMSKCNHNIIANSSYSWWSAYLNSNPDKIVIAPKSWGNLLKGREDDNDLLPEDWIKL